MRAIKQIDGIAVITGQLRSQLINGGAAKTAAGSGPECLGNNAYAIFPQPRRQYICIMPRNPCFARMRTHTILKKYAYICGQPLLQPLCKYFRADVGAVIYTDPEWPG